MSSILIAYDNDGQSCLHDFFEACADEAKQACTEHGISFNPVCPPNLVEGNVIGVMQNHQLCFIAAHGDNDGIYNEAKEGVISTKTTNYGFSGKGLYSIVCSCAQNLHPHLQSIGLQFFVGYNNSFMTKGDLDPFITSAMSGLKSILSGDNIDAAKRNMYASFDEQINILGQTDAIAASLLLNNKEALVFEGEGDLVLSDLLQTT